MKRWWIAGLLFVAATAHAGQLQVHVPNLTPDAEGRLGVLIVNLCDNPDCYDHDGEAGHTYLNRQRDDLPAQQPLQGTDSRDVHLPRPPHRDLLGRPASRPRQRRRRHLRHLLPR